MNGFRKLGRALQEAFWARVSLWKVHPPQEVLEAGATPVCFGGKDSETSMAAAKQLVCLALKRIYQ